ncbi:hypothetical protein GCM10029964_054920 [Kibdelosporangium lantanae]
MNQDGASNGLTAPNGPSQQRVIRAALAGAGLRPSDVDAVEAHGTGTALGDPIEAQALLATYGQDRDRPLWLGSVKSNIGHTQAAAGVAGVIKMVMAMRHGLLPRTLHVDEPSPHVDWSAGDVRLLTEHTEWPRNGHPRRAAVSSFGMSGTNAHVILEQPADEPVPTGTPDAPDVHAWVLSAKTDAALRDQAARLSAHLVEDRPADVAYSLATTRAALDRRLVAIGASQDELVRHLRTHVDGGTHADLVDGVVTPGSTAVLFPGQGPQRVGMGRELYEAYPVFAEAFDAACAALDTPVRDVLWGEGPDLLDRTEYAQPGLFATEVAVYRLLESWGLRPDYVLGHSFGEVAAAHVAGVLSLADAARLVEARGRLMQALPAGGLMMAVEASEQDILPLLTDRLGIAAVNGPSACVISGDEREVLAIGRDLTDRGRRIRPLRVSHASHSPLIDPMLTAYRAVAESLTYHRPGIPIVSTVTGRLVTGDEMGTAEHWVRNVRETVRFDDGIRCLEANDVVRYLEITPDATVSTMVEQCLVGADPVVVATAMSRNRPERTALLAAAARMWTDGAAVDWAAVHGGRAARRVPLPTYPFQRARYWVDFGAARPAARGRPPRRPGSGTPSTGRTWTS